MTREQLLQELLVERYGPLPTIAARTPTPAEVTEFESQETRCSPTTQTTP